MNNQMSGIKEKLQVLGKKALVFGTNHRMVIIFFITGIAILMALLQTRNYLNPVRNEDRYKEAVLKIKYTTIKDDIVEKLKNTENDPSVVVDPSLVPDRSNPFNE